MNLIFILQWRRNQGTYTLQCFGKYLEGCIFVIVAEQWIEDYVLKPNDRTRSLPLNINTPLFIEGPVQIHEHWWSCICVGMFLRYLYWILKMCRVYGIFYFSFNCIKYSIMYIYLYNTTPNKAIVNPACNWYQLQADVGPVLFINELKNLTNVVIGQKLNSFTNKTIITTFF